MASTGKKWAIGCGNGCLLLLIIGGVITGGVVLGVKDIAKRAEVVEVHLDELDDRFGDLDTWSPPADGTLDAATVQIFLVAREGIGARGAELAALIETLEGEGRTMDKIKAGVKLIPTLLEFVGQRAAVLLEHDQHPGEHTFIYAVSYFSWLGHDPGDGPNFRLDGNEDEDKSFHWQTSNSDHDVKVDRERTARRALNDLFLTWLGSQQEALAAAGAADSEWAATLERELDALRGDPERIAWEDGLPEPLAASLSPYRSQFEAAYSELLNGLEVSILEDN